MAVYCYPDKQYCAYFTEVQDIEDHCVDDAQDDESAATDEGEQSAGFLNDLGVKIEDITFFEVAEHSKLGDVQLTPAQRATLRRHVERVQTTLRPHSKQRTDVRHFFEKHEHKVSSKSDDGRPKKQKDDVAHCVTDGSALSRVQMHQPLDRKLAVTKDVPVDHVYIPPPDYSMSDELMAVPSGASPSLSPSKTHSSVAVSSNAAEDSSALCGITVVDDLGRKDRKMLTTLAHLELMILFDDCRITFSRKKARRKGSDHGIFNVALQTLLDKDRKKCPHLKVPLIFQELVQYLEKNGLREAGLLRVSGRLARIKELREKLDRHYNKGKPISFDTVALHDAAALIKLFLRELPEPLLTSERVNAFVQVDSILDVQKQLYALNMLILVLPEVNRNVLLMLLDFLDKVVKEPANKMTAENVAMVIAPNVFLVSSGSRNRPQAMDRELKLAVATSKITLLLLDNRNSLWTVPVALIGQIRQKREDSSSTNPIMRLLGSKDKADVRNRISSGNDMEISVKVESTGSDAKINLSSSTTVGDVIELLMRSPQMRRKKQSSQQVTDEAFASSYCLYEVGGNIGERRLDYCANMISVCQVNPNAKYIIRSQPE